MLIKRKVRKMRRVRFELLASAAGQVLLSPLRRVRDVSRSKPRAKAVGGSRKSAGEVDGSETGSANERGLLRGALSFRQSARTLPGERPLRAFLEGGCFAGFASSAAKPQCRRIGFIECSRALASALGRPRRSGVHLGGRLLSVPLVRDARGRRQRRRPRSCSRSSVGALIFLFVRDPRRGRSGTASRPRPRRWRP